jgi:hypothetical protein
MSKPIRVTQFHHPRTGEVVYDVATQRQVWSNDAKVWRWFGLGFNCDAATAGRLVQAALTGGVVGKIAL